jgi:galactokinase
VNVIGEHLDYNGGFVLPAAIDRRVSIAGVVCPAAKTIEFHSLAMNDTLRLESLASLLPQQISWRNYVLGVVAGFVERGFNIPPLRAVIHSNLPAGSGLSSSAALEVAVATFLETIIGVRLDPRDKSLLCQQAEHRFANVKCGIMDQYTSVFGRRDSLMLLDCRSLQLEFIPFDDPDVTIMVANSNARHRLADGQYDLRVRQCQEAAQELNVNSLRDCALADLQRRKRFVTDVNYRRARHVVSEIDRTLKAVDAIRDRRWQDVGQLLYESHDSLRGDFEVSCRELDALVDICRKIGPAGGVFGSRMTGAGFGGSIIALVRTDCADRLSQIIQREYINKTGIQASVFATRPSNGATVQPHV